MALILAIEPDKRQSGQLASLVKGQLRAELVHGATVAEGLASLHGRVPDLVLTSSLISPRDETALATHLRDLGAAAAHVQAVTIPMLGTAEPARAKGGLLAALRREKPQPMTDGCAPEAFAEQIRQYLATAEEQKIAAATRLASEPAALAEPVAVPEPIEVEFAPLEAETFVGPVAVEEPVVAEEPIAEGDEWATDEPAGLPLSQLLQLVTETAVVEEPILDAPAPTAEVEAIAEVEPFETVEEFAEVEAVAELEAVSEVAPPEEIVSVVESEPVAEPAGDFGELYMDPVAAQALDDLSRQAAPPSLADGIPAEAPVPVVEMHSFQSLDSIASELAAGPSQRYERLDDLASLFAAAPAPPAMAAPYAAPARVEPSHDFTAPPRDDTSPFASLFATPAPQPTHHVAAIQPDVDPSLFASAPSTPAIVEAPAVPAFAELALELDTFEPVPVLEAEPAPEPEPIFVQPVQEIVPEPELVAPAPALEPEPIFAEPVIEQLAAPVFEVEPEPEPAFESAVEPEPEPLPVVAAAPEPEQEPEFEPEALAAAPALDEEISLDVDAFIVPPVEPSTPAEPTPFAFTLVDGFGDAWSDFEVPSVEAVAADLGLGEHTPMDPYAMLPTAGTASAQIEVVEDETPALDAEALSLIGDAARKVSLDAFVIEEFERGLSSPRPKKASKKKHAGATQVPPPAERPAKPAKRPVQDEWGMFDPEQCGFAALEDEEGAEARPRTGTRVRVISY